VRRSGGDATGTPKKGHRRTRSTGFIVSEIIKRATTDDVGRCVCSCSLLGLLRIRLIDDEWCATIRAGMATQAMIPPSLVVEEESEESGLFGRKQSKRSSTVSARYSSLALSFLHQLCQCLTVWWPVCLCRVRAAHQIFRATTQPTLGRPEDREPFPPKRVPLTDEEVLRPPPLNLPRRWR
jgi:hypothetical protein